MTFLILTAVGPVYSSSPQEKLIDSSRTDYTVTLNETVIFNGRVFQVIKFIENGEKKIILTPLNRLGEPLSKREKPKISSELQKMIADSPNKSVSITIILKEQPLRNISKKIRDKYKPEIQRIKSKVKSLYSKARSRALSKKGAQVAGGKVKKNEEKAIDISSFLTPIEKQEVLIENSNFEKTKQQMVREIIGDTKKQILLQQQKVKKRIIELGGVIEGEGTFFNVLFAKLPASKIDKIAKLSEIDFIEKTAIYKPLLDTSTYSIHANTFWNNDYIGSPWDVAVIDTGVDSTHPALSSRYIDGKDFVTNDCDGNDPDDNHGHGTHVAGIVASTDSTYRGVSPGASIINAKPFHSSDCINWYASEPNVMSAIDWSIYNATGYAEIISASLGKTTSSSETPFSIYFDALVDSLKIVAVIAAGNSGDDCGSPPCSQSIEDPGISYNAITVGAMTDKGTISRSDDSIAYYSSRGPVPSSSRIKPDLMAPGGEYTNDCIYSTSNTWEGTPLGFDSTWCDGDGPTSGYDFVGMQGTSMATPHISGAAALLMSRGVYDPREIKALLINTAEDYGPTGGDYDYGWGYVDLNHAFFHTSDVRLGTVNTSTTYLFYKGYAYSGDKATLVWNRHATYAGAIYPTTYYNLSDLDIYMYAESNNSLISKSTSADENVEQVISSVNANVVLKVDTANFASGITSETFALATEEGFTLASGPSLTATISNPATVTPNKVFNVSVKVTNNGDLTSHNVSVTLNLPSGFNIVSGSNPQTIGSINAGGSGTAIWSVISVGGEGNYTISTSVSSSSYGESYSASDTNSVSVDATSPIITFVSPTPSNNTILNQNWIYINVTSNENLDTALLEWNGVNESMNRGSWYKNKTGLIDGTYTFRVWGNDSVGNWGVSETRKITIDTTPPGIVIISPKNATIADSTPLLNATFGEVVNHTWYSIDSDTNSTPFENTRNLTLNLSQLEDGVHNITVFANDSLGNLNFTTVWFTIDTTPPTINIHSPPNASTSNTTILLNVTFDEVVNATWYNNGTVNSTPEYGVSNLTVNLPILTEGPHNITVYANDSLGNLNFTTIWFTIDTSPPSIIIVSPKNKTYSTPLLPLNVTADEMVNTWWYSINGTANKTFTPNTTISAGEGVNNLTVWGNDNVGNIGTTTVYFTIDTTPPIIIVQSPLNTTIRDNTPLLNVTFLEEVNHTWYNLDDTTNNTPISQTTNLTLNLSIISDGAHSVTIYANDSAGNLNVSKVYFTIDTSPPRLIVTYPENKSYYNVSWFNATVYDEITPQGLNVTLELDGLNNYTLQNTSGNWNYQNTNGLPEGVHRAVFFANDSLGNTNTTTVYFTIDRTPPEVHITSPENKTYRNSSVFLKLTRTDNVDISTTVYSVDGAANQTYTKPTWITGLTNGTHTITVYTNDTAGNTNTTRITFTTDIINETLKDQTINTPKNWTNITTKNVYINITTTKPLTAKINITVYHATPPTINQSLKITRYIEIQVTDNLNATSGNLSWAILRVNYTDAEIQAQGLDESTLRLYWWNPQAKNWTKLDKGTNLTAQGGPYVNNAGVNTTANYVWANITHFSIYGISGETKTTTTTTTTTTGGGGGGGGGSAVNKSDLIYFKETFRVDGLILLPDANVSEDWQAAMLIKNWLRQRGYTIKVKILSQYNKNTDAGKAKILIGGHMANPVSRQLGIGEYFTREAANKPWLINGQANKGIIKIYDRDPLSYTGRGKTLVIAGADRKQTLRITWEFLAKIEEQEKQSPKQNLGNQIIL